MSVLAGFFLRLSSVSKELSPSAHAMMANANDPEIRMEWAQRSDGPLELTLKRIKVETDEAVLSYFAYKQFSPEITLAFIEKKRIDLMVESAINCYSAADAENAADILKFIKKTDPEMYFEELAKVKPPQVNEFSFGYEGDGAENLTSLFIEDLPAETLPMLTAQWGTRSWKNSGPKLLKRLAQEKPLDGLGCIKNLAMTEKFSKLNRELRELAKQQINMMLAQEAEGKLPESVFALAWWAGEGPRPSGNGFAMKMENKGTVAKEEAPLLRPDDPESAVTKLLEENRREYGKEHSVLGPWADKHEKAVSYQRVAQWFKIIAQGNFSAASLILKCADQPHKLRGHIPEWVGPEDEVLIGLIENIEDVKDFPFQAVLELYENPQELFSFIEKASDGQLDVFQALGETYEGTLGEFIEVIKAFKAENTPM